LPAADFVAFRVPANPDGPAPRRLLIARVEAPLWQAELWARLGNTENALQIAQLVVHDKDASIRKTARILEVKGRAPTVKAVVNRWNDRTDQLEATLGLIEAESTSSSRAHSALLRSFEQEIRLLDDPKLRSKYMAEIGILWVKAGNVRETIRVADDCSPADNLLVLSHLLNDRSRSK
jgi:hypothetical protein